MGRRPSWLLVGVVVCVAVAGIPTTGSAAVESAEQRTYVVSGETLLIYSEERFGFEKYDGSLGNGDPFSQTVEADTSTDQLTFNNWRIDAFDTTDYGVNLRADGTASTITDPNGDSFRFVSFTTEVFCGNTWSFDVVGYEDGSAVPGATESFSLGGVGGPTTRSVGFGSVDEVRFENFNSDNTNQCLTIDDIVVDQAVSSNTVPSFSNLDPTITYDEASGTPVVVDSDAAVTDTELDGAGDYAGSTLTVAREGGANADDSYGFDTSAGTFAVSGSELQTGGATFATYTESGGTLTIDFTSAETTATPALVDDVLQGVTYENTGDPAVVEYGLTLTFEDGDSGGSLTTSESQPVVFDPALSPMSTSTILDFTGLGPELANQDPVDARNVRELLFYGYDFGDAAENSLIDSNELQFDQATSDPAATGTRFESDEPFALDALDIDNYGSSEQDVTVYGYRDGTQVASQTYTMAATRGYQTKDIDADDTGFQRVDEVRFTRTEGDQVAIDNIVVDQSNTPPTVDLDTDAGGTDASVTFSENDDQGTGTSDSVAVTGSTSLSDADGSTSTVTVTLDNPQGDTGEGLVIDTGALAADLGVTTNTNTIAITRNAASTAELEAAIEAVRFQDNSDAPDTTDRTVTVTATDDAGATASATSTVAVQPGNDGPSITAPGGTLQPTEDVSFDLSGANEIQVSDPDVGGALMSVSLAANRGTLTLGSTTGLAFDSGTNGASSFTVSGTETDINNALATLDYQGDTDYAGIDTVTATVSDNGKTGTDPGLTSDGSEEIDTTAVSLDVQAVEDAPTIAAIGDQPTDEDQPLTGVSVTVDDAETAAGRLTLSFSSDTPSLIESHSFGGSGRDRTLDITPAADQSGTTLVTATVSDGSLTASEDFQLTIDAVNDLPTITSVDDVTVEEDSAVPSISFTVDDVESGGSGVVVTATSGDQTLVQDANLDVIDTGGGDRTLDISLAPDATGTTTISLVADDGTDTRTEQFDITATPVNDPPSISDPSDTTLDEDTEYAVTPTVTDPDTGDTTTFSITNQPSWASFDTSTGELSGTPTNADVGSYDGIEVTVEDSASATDTSEPFRVVVENVNDPPTIPDPGDQTTDEDADFSFTPTATDVDTGDTLIYSASGIPEWATFDTSTGQIFGTPTNADVGSYTGMEITVEDESGLTDTTAPFGIEVRNTNDAPTITDPADATLDEDTAYSVTLTANDVDVGDAATFSITNQPSWASFDTSTGELSGMPTNADVGTYSDIQITVEDAAGATDTTDPFSVEVTNVNDPPTISDPADATVDEDTVYSVTPTVTNVDAGDTTTVSITNRPSWASFDTSTGELSGTPTNADVGSYDGIEITVEDSGSLTDTTAPFSIDVQNVNDAPTITAVDDITVDEDAGVQTVTATVADVDADTGQLTTGYSVDGGPLFDTGNVSIGRNGATVTLDVSINADAVGTDTVTLTADDGALTTQERFDITTEAANDAPSFTSGADQTVTNDTSQQTVADFATGFAPGGGADESGQTVAGYVVTVVSDPNGTLDGVYVATDGTLTYTPNESAEGTAAVDVAVQDDGGTGNGGTDTAPTQRFNVTVDTRPPAVTDATTEQTNLTLVTDEALSTADERVPAGADFTVTAGGEPISVTNTTVAGRNLTLPLGSAVGGGEIVTLNYTRGSAVPQDAGGNRLAGFTNQSVTNHVPLAVNDTYTIDEDRTLGVDAANGTLANDTDADDPETLSAVVSTNVSHGTLSLYANGSFEYEPSQDYNGDDSFTYEVADAAGNTDTGRVNITVNPVSDSSGGGGLNTPDRPTVAVGAGDETTDGGTESNSATVSVSNAQANQPVQISLTDAETDGDETTDERDIDVLSIDVTVTESTDFELSVTTTEMPGGSVDGTDEDGTPDDNTSGTETVSIRNFAEETGAQAVGYVTVEHDVPDEQISGVNFTFRVRQTYLDTSGVDTESVALYRDETTRWNRLSTTLVEETESRYVFRATSPGLSVFTIGASQPRFAVTETALGADSVEPGDTVDVTATVRNRGTDNGTYTVALAGNGSVVATQSVAVPVGTNRTVTLSPTFPTPGTYVLTVDNESVGTVVVQATTDETPTTTPETPPTVEATATTTGGSGDGMGVVAALLALSLVAVRYRHTA